MRLFHLITLSLLSSIAASIESCPAFTQVASVVQEYAHKIQWIKSVPNTNILLVYTLNSSANFLYYLDISQPEERVINIVQPEFAITFCIYLEYRNMFVAVNNLKMVFTDVYMFEEIERYELPEIQSVEHIKDTNYMLILMQYSILHIMDLEQKTIVRTLDCSLQPYQFGSWQHQMTQHTLKDGTYIVIITGMLSTYSWTIDLATLDFTYNGVILQSTNTDNLMNLKYFNTPTPTFVSASDYYIFVFNVTVDLPNKSFNFTNASSPKSFAAESYISSGSAQDWLYIEHKNQIALGAKQLFILDLDTYTLSQWLRQQSSLQRRLKYEENTEGLFFSLYYKSSSAYLQYYYRKSFGQVSVQTTLPTLFNITQNSGYRVKGCPACFIMKVPDYYFFSTNVYPTGSAVTKINFYSTSGLKWDYVGKFIDPYYYQGSQWVAFGLQYVTSPGYLFTLFNLGNSTITKLKLPSTHVNATTLNYQTTMFAMASLENTNNQELFGIDKVGNVYSFDIAYPNNFKTFFTLSNCTKSEVGDVFHNGDSKWLIFICGNSNQVVVYDIQKKTETYLLNFAFTPKLVRAFSDPAILTVGGLENGNLYIFKFNSVTQSFDFTMIIKPGKAPDNLLWVELLKDKSLWIQYDYSNKFFDISVCLADLNRCLNCEYVSYYKSTNIFDTVTEFGIGTQANPFLNPWNILAHIHSASMYSSAIEGISNVQVRLVSDPAYELELFKTFYEFSFSSVISLIFQSQSDSQHAKLIARERLSFANFKQITFQQVDFMNYLASSSSTCGMNITSIELGVSLLDFTLNSNDTQKACIDFNINAANLTINAFKIANADFSYQDTIFSVSNAAKISISGLEVTNSIISDSQSFMRSSTNTIATLSNISFTNNKCSLNQNKSTVPVSFFEAGLLQASNITIHENSFCNKILFNILAASNHTNYAFTFDDIHITQNTFNATSSSVFFDSTYSMITDPSHSFLLTNSGFISNTLMDSSPLPLSALISTTKIATITCTNITFIDHSDISLATFTDTTNATFAQITSQNSQDQFNALSISESNTNNIVTLTEFQACSFEDILIDSKKIRDDSLISLTNSDNADTTVHMRNITMNNILLKQSESIKHVSPINIESNNVNTITIDDAHFTNNTLVGLSYALVYGTTAILIDNSFGDVTITNSSFRNSTSDSQLNVLSINCDELNIADSTFSQSTTTTSLTSNNILIEGGFLRAKINSLSITHSTFEKAYALIGAFLYLESSQNEESLKISIATSTFSEGFAKQEAAAIYIDSTGTTVSFTCDTCTFSHLYTMISLASSFAFKDQAVTQSTTPHSIRFTQATISNIYGYYDNFFVSVKRSQVILENSSMFSDDTVPALYMNYESNSQNKQQSSLVKATSYSTVELISSSIYNLKYQLKSSKLALLIHATLGTNVSVDRLKFEHASFSRSAIEVINGNLSIVNSNFTDITQATTTTATTTTRVLMTAKTPDTTAPSLVILQSSILSADTVNFTKITCLSNCNGAAFQLLSSNFNIASTNVQESSAKYGGAIYVLGTNGNSFITDSIFSNNESGNDGGAIYFKALSGEVFSINVENTEVSNNKADSGQGGAFFIRSGDTDSPDQSITLTSTHILNNVAEVGGGINSENIKPTLTETNFQGNVGITFGSDSVTYPAQLILSNSQEFLENQPTATLSKDKLVVNSFQSGQSLDSLTFEMKTEQNEIYIPLDDEIKSYEVSVSIDSDSIDYSKLELRGDKTVSYSSAGGFSFSDLVFVGVPGQSAKLSVTSSQIKVYNETTKEYGSSYAFDIEVNLRKCISGEIVNTYGVYTECLKCKAGTYSFDITQCNDCLVGATCAGGNSIIPNAGYWQRETSNLNILECANQLSNCLGNQPGNPSCFEGHIGALCEECDIHGEFWGNSYAKSGKYGCVDCNKINYNILIVVLMALWAQATMYLAIKGDIDILEQKAAGKLLKKHFYRRSTLSAQAQNQNAPMSASAAAAAGISIRSRGINRMDNLSANKTSIYIKMITNYFFIVGSISTFNLSIPTGIVSFPQSIGQPLQQTMNSLDCILKDFQSPGIPLIYLRLMFSVVIPLVYLTIFIFGQVILFYLKRFRTKFPMYILSTASIFMVVYVQPDLVTQAIALISCRQIGDKSYILSNVNFECMTEEYSKYSLSFLTPLLVLLVVIIPLSLFGLLKSNKNSLEESSIKLKYGFLYKEYKSNTYYWEFVKMIEKLAIILTLNFYSQQIVTKGILVFIEISFYSILSLIMKPFREEEVNKIDVRSTNVCAITVLLAIFIYKNEFDYFVYISVIVILGVNLWFIQMIVRKLLSAYVEKFSDLLMKIKAKLPILAVLIKEKPKRPTFRPELKMKIRSISQLFVQMAADEKKCFIVQYLRSQLRMEYPKIFNEKKQISQELVKSSDLNSEQILSQRIVPKQSKRVKASDPPVTKQSGENMLDSLANFNLPTVVFQTDQNEVNLIRLESDCNFEMSQLDSIQFPQSEIGFKKRRRIPKRSENYEDEAESVGESSEFNSIALPQTKFAFQKGNQFMIHTLQGQEQEETSNANEDFDSINIPQSKISTVFKSHLRSQQGFSFDDGTSNDDIGSINIPSTTLAFKNKANQKIFAFDGATIQEFSDSEN